MLDGKGRASAIALYDARYGPIKQGMLLYPPLPLGPAGPKVNKGGKGLIDLQRRIPKGVSTYVATPR